MSKRRRLVIVIEVVTVFVVIRIGNKGDKMVNRIEQRKCLFKQQNIVEELERVNE